MATGAPQSCPVCGQPFKLKPGSNPAKWFCGCKGKELTTKKDWSNTRRKVTPISVIQPTSARRCVHGLTPPDAQLIEV